MDPYNNSSKPPHIDVIDFPSSYVIVHNGNKPQELPLNAHDDPEAMEKVHEFVKNRRNRATIGRTQLSTGEIYQVQEIFGVTVGEFL